LVSIKQAVENGKATDVVNVYRKPVIDIERILDSRRRFLSLDEEEIATLETPLKRLHLEQQFEDLS
jgi:hypothetical protein